MAGLLRDAIEGNMYMHRWSFILKFYKLVVHIIKHVKKYIIIILSLFR